VKKVESKNIYQRISAIMAEGIYIKKGNAGQGTGVLYDEVISILNKLMVKYGVVSATEKHGESRSRAAGKNGNYVYECDFVVSLINIDNPQDKVSVRVEAHAMDSGDKAPGKAITYATKTALLKLFSIETGINDESREELKEIKEGQKPITSKELKELEELLQITSSDMEKAVKHVSNNLKTGLLHLNQAEAYKLKTILQQKAKQNGNN
jgi:hypothetical protein